MADKLYFEPVYWEHVREIIELEKPYGVIVQLGGQTALQKMAEKMHEHGIRIIGTSFDNMDIAEDRGRFSDLRIAKNWVYLILSMVLPKAPKKRSKLHTRLVTRYWLAPEVMY